MLRYAECAFVSAFAVAFVFELHCVRYAMLRCVTRGNVMLCRVVSCRVVSSQVKSSRVESSQVKSSQVVL